MEDQELTQPRGSAAFFGRAIVRELRAVSGSPAEAGGSYFVMGQSNRITLVVLFPSLITLYGCQDLVPRDTQSLFFPGLQRSEIFGFLAGFGTTFAAVPDLVSMLKRRSRAGMYPMMAAIMGTFSDPLGLLRDFDCFATSDRMERGRSFDKFPNGRGLRLLRP